MTTRTIHTDTFTPKSMAILTALKDFMFKYWGSGQMERNARLAKLEVAPNGENVWTVDNDGWSYQRSTYSTRNDNSVREWLACSLKHIIYSEFKAACLPESKEWKRTNKRVVKYLSTEGNEVTVAEAYCLFDRLLNRKTFDKRWQKKMVSLIVGKERDPIATELEVARSEEAKKLEEKFRIDTQALESEKYNKLERVRSEVYALYAKKQEALQAAYKQSCKELEDAMKFATNSGLAAVA